MEIVDRFGDWHDLLGLKIREQFWKEGFEITSRKDFCPECSVLHVRLIGLATAIAQVKGGNRVERWHPHSVIFGNSLTWIMEGLPVIRAESAIWSAAS